MKTVIEMAREAGIHAEYTPGMIPLLERFAELVRADERNSWPAEMEAMERQVNILTDALNDRQRWFDAVTVQHKQAILAEREACAKVCESLAGQQWVTREAALECSDAIRVRGNT